MRAGWPVTGTQGPEARDGGAQGGRPEAGWARPPEPGASGAHASDQAQVGEATAPGPGPQAAGTWPFGRVGPPVPSTKTGLGHRKSPGSTPSSGPGPGSPSLLPRLPGAWAPRPPAPMGLNLSSLCSKLFSKPGGEWLSCYQHGSWALGNALSSPRSTKGPFVPLPAPRSALPGPPPTRLPPPAPPARCTPGLRGVTMAWPWRLPLAGAWEPRDLVAVVAILRATVRSSGLGGDMVGWLGLNTTPCVAPPVLGEGPSLPPAPTQATSLH